MYDILKEQFHSKKAFAQSKNFNVVRPEKIPTFFNDMYPLAQDYYHELNPYFLAKLYHPDLFKFSDVITVRDGYVTFAHFLLTHFANFSKLGPKLYLIHKDLAKLVPYNLAPYFATWTLVQDPKKSIILKDAKTVVIFAFGSDDFFGDLEIMRERLHPLKNIPQDAKVEVYTPVRRNVFELKGKESLAIHHLINEMKDALSGREFTFLNSEQFFDKTDFKNTYVLDLSPDKYHVSDSYLHYYALSRGATVNHIDTKTPEDSFFDIALSFNHELHIAPLPKIENAFADLLFYAKSTANKDYLFDPSFQDLVRNLFK